MNRGAIAFETQNGRSTFDAGTALRAPFRTSVNRALIDDLVESGPSSLLRLSLMTQSGALMFELRAAEQAITPVQGAVVAYAPPFTRPAWPPHGSSGGWG